MKHVHFIGICGVAMAPVAKMMLDLGWQVSGSDAGFYPPVSDYLKKYPEIKFYPGFHPEKMKSPDVVVVGSFVSMSNPEFKYARDNKIPYKCYAEIVQEYLIKEKSIVCAGTYGKTTSTALCAWILETAGMNPSYMAGGMLNNFVDPARTTDSKWSVVEGDEYVSSRWNPVSKFFYYDPKYLLITAAEWDHSDVFLTEEKFVDNFKKLVSQMPKDGIIVANKLGINIDKVVENAPCKVVFYQGRKSGENNIYHVVKREHGNSASHITIENADMSFSERFTTSLIGSHMIDNATGVVALLHEVGVPTDSIRSGLRTFLGTKRRLEVRGKTVSGATVIDDLAHSPAKALAVQHAIGHWFPLNTRMFVVYEPNVGNRTAESVPSYDRAFGLAHEVIIPRLSKVKTREGETRLNGNDIAEVIRKTQENVKYMENDDDLVNYLKENAHKGDVIIFMGAHGFRGMIEQVLETS